MTNRFYPSKTVYLAGAITGLTHDEARFGWRKEFADLLPSHVLPLSPMRGKDFLKDAGVLIGDPDMYPQHAMATAKGIMCRDGNDVKNCDLMVANFLGTTKASVGTAIEFGLAHAYRKPVILIIEPQGLQERPVLSDSGDDHTTIIKPAVVNPHWHGMIQAIAGYIVPTVQEAAFIASHLLTAGV